MGKIRLRCPESRGSAWVSVGCVVQVVTIWTGCKDRWFSYVSPAGSAH